VDKELTFRLPESGLYGCWIVREGMVNMTDLANCQPGQIIRVRSDDAIRYIPGPLEPYDHIAGMISDAA
jgi:hypothetical protein